MMAEGIVSVSFAAFILSGGVQCNVGFLNTLPLNSHLKEKLRLSHGSFLYHV